MTNEEYEIRRLSAKIAMIIEIMQANDLSMPSHDEIDRRAEEIADKVKASTQ